MGQRPESRWRIFSDKGPDEAAHLLARLCNLGFPLLRLPTVEFNPLWVVRFHVCWEGTMHQFVPRLNELERLNPTDQAYY